MAEIGCPTLLCFATLIGALWIFAVVLRIICKIIRLGFIAIGGIFKSHKPVKKGEKKMTAGELRGIVVEDLKKREWHFSTKDFDDDACAIDTGVHSDSGCIKGYDVRLLFHKYDMQAIYYIPVRAPECARKEVAENLMRINWRTDYGKFIVNFEDGEIRVELLVYRAAIESDVREVTRDTFGMMCDTIDRYVAGLMAVVSGAKSAADAFAEAWKKKDEPPAEKPEDASPEASPDKKTEVGARVVEEPVGRDEPDEDSESSSASESTDDNRMSENYTLTGLNIQGAVPLEKIVAAVKRFREGEKNPQVDSPRLNILLSGVPGSGKTAFVKYLARTVGMPLKRVCASDLLSHYAGMTEHNIADVFRNAKKNGEMLFLDEIDSFLQDRSGASHGWEVSQVNELLQRMEDFGGVMVGATNFADNLDKAVIRRFTYKLKLDYLTDEGKAEFFERYFKTQLTDDERIRLNAIDNLTPGDFRTVKEELFYLSDCQTNDERLAALETESAAKGRTCGKIGF